MPVSTFFFLSTGPHDIAVALACTLPFWLMLAADGLIRDTSPQQNSRLNSGYYNGILLLLSLLQFVNVLLMLDAVSLLRWETQTDIFPNLVNLMVIRFLVGTSSGTSGIVVAHELIHRPQWALQGLGRLLLSTVCYEHFVITHKRGHHLSIGMPDDIASARLGESFKHYWKRVYGGHVRFAWRSEEERIAGKQGRVSGFAVLRNQVFWGFLAELMLWVLIILVFGWLAAFMFLYQALAAVRILEAVNYFQHWGLDDERYANTYGWVSHSPISRYALIGLSHHIGHHENEQMHFHKIKYSDQGPKMPYGYFVMNFWVKLDNASYQAMAVRELERYCNKRIPD
ncbi:MAG: fatty acid desaturase [Methylococcaceae bacterium]|nr:fatty acid desaturase [Methylococcaceae bacterium]